MTNTTLKSADAIKTIVAADTKDTEKTKVPQQRRIFLAGRVQAAGLELPQVLPVMISQATNKDEADFIRSLVETKEPTAVAKPEEKSHAIGGNAFVADDAPHDHE